MKLLKVAPSRNNDDAKKPKKVTSLTKGRRVKSPIENRELPSMKRRDTLPAHRDFVDWLARFPKPLSFRIRHQAAAARCVG